MFGDRWLPTDMDNLRNMCNLGHHMLQEKEIFSYETLLESLKSLASFHSFLDIES